MCNPMPISRALKVYAATYLVRTKNIDCEGAVLIIEGTEITVADIRNPRAPDSRAFVGTCIAHPFPPACEEGQEERWLPPNIDSRCIFNIDEVRFDAPMAVSFTGNIATMWGSTKIACTVSRITNSLYCAL